MTEKFLDKIRTIPSFERAIVPSVTLSKADNTVEISVVTDKTFTSDSESALKKIAREYVPEYFSCRVVVNKLTPDEKMVAKKIYSLISQLNRQLAAFVTPEDITVERTENGFYFTIKVVHASVFTRDFEKAVESALANCFCGEFSGKCVTAENKIDDIVIEEEQENIEYVLPARTFEISDFSFIEGMEIQKTAIYLSDVNFISENVVVCGKIEHIRERTFQKQNGREKLMYNFVINDGTAALRVSYFARQKSIEKIKKLQVGDSIVCTCKTDTFNGEIRTTANFIDYGKTPENFVPEKRASKPVPRYYETVKPAPYEDYTQSDLFADNALPDCLKNNVFVVFDLETTGLNSSPSAGNMDRIIEIGAYKIIGGAIKESFNTFVNPQRKLSAEIINLTGIDQQTVDGAPVYEKVMPDFFKFCEGAYLVGHNAANFDFKFIEYYSSKCGYFPERRLFDTLPLSQQLLQLANFKLNTVADHFGITFNHHRAADDALVTAKIFIELLKIKKVLPNPC